MNKLLLVSAGGALGALLRYGLSGLAYRALGEAFPWGTLAVNVVGCLLIGGLWALSERVAVPPAFSAFVLIGTLGAFTTFSTFGLETFSLFRDGEIGLGIANVVATNAACLASVFVGFWLGQQLPRLILSGGAS